MPFINIENDPPALAGIKKVINCLYHAEEALKTLESISAKEGYLKMAKDGFAAMRQLYNSLALLHDAEKLN